MGVVTSASDHHSEGGLEVLSAITQRCQFRIVTKDSAWSKLIVSDVNGAKNKHIGRVNQEVEGFVSLFESWALSSNVKVLDNRELRCNLLVKEKN